MPITLIAAVTTLQSLGGFASAVLSDLKEGAALEANFQLNKIQIHLHIEGNSIAQDVIREATTWCLVLAKGTVSTAQLNTAMAASGNTWVDQTPADGGNSLMTQQDLQSRIIRILYPRDLVIIKDEAATDFGTSQVLEFTGAPLDNTIDGVGSSYFFPEGEGMEWFVYNYGDQALDDSLIINGLIRHWGKWTK